MISILETVARVGTALEQAGAGWFVGGSVASSLQGEPRQTNDVDIVTDLEARKVGAFVSALGPDFSADDVALQEAALRRGSWNLFYLPDFTKIDVFFAKFGAFDRAEFARRAPHSIAGVSRPLFVKSVEDSILRKLLWYREGGDVSDRQLRDTVMLWRLNAGRLDVAYLDQWAETLGVGDLLARIRAA